jgi:hypothetical protein
MKLSEIKVGETYFVSTRDNWEDDALTASWSYGYTRYAVRVTSLTRYSRVSSYSSTYREDSKGQYLYGMGLKADGTDGAARYFLARYVRGTWEDCKTIADQRQATLKAAAEKTAGDAAAKADIAETLRNRLAGLGITGIEVHATDGRGYKAGSPKVVVKFEETYLIDPAETLTAILDRLEAAEKAARVAEADAAHLANGGASDGWQPPAAHPGGVYAGLAERLEQTDRQPADAPWQP